MSIRHRFFGSLSAFAVAAIVAGGSVSATLAVASSSPALAQDQPAQGEAGAAGGRRKMGEILLSLNLSDAQKSQIKSIMADTRKQNAGVTDREQRRANWNAAKDKIDAVLTPDQRTAFHAKMAALRNANGQQHAQ